MQRFARKRVLARSMTRGARPDFDEVSRAVLQVQADVKVLLAVSSNVLRETVVPWLASGIMCIEHDEVVVCPDCSSDPLVLTALVPQSAADSVFQILHRISPVIGPDEFCFDIAEGRWVERSPRAS